MTEKVYKCPQIAVLECNCTRRLQTHFHTIQADAKHEESQSPCKDQLGAVETPGAGALMGTPPPLVKDHLPLCDGGMGEKARGQLAESGRDDKAQVGPGPKAPGKAT